MNSTAGCFKVTLKKMDYKHLEIDISLNIAHLITGGFFHAHKTIMAYFMEKNMFLDSHIFNKYILTTEGG